MIDSVSVFPPGTRMTDSATGAPLSGAVIRFYDAETTTPKIVYADADLATSLGTSVTTDSLGYPTSDGTTKTLIYVGTAPYKVVIETSAGAIVASHDNIKGAVEITDPGDLNVVFSRPVETKSLNYTVLDADQSKVFAVNCSGGDVTLTLPSAVSVGNGWFVTIQHAGSANQTMVATTASQTISSGASNYAGSLVMARSGEEATFVSDGGNWRATAHTAPHIKSSQGVITVADILSSPPGSPEQGAHYLLGASPSGAWSSYAEHDLVQYTGAAWVKVTPPTDSGWLVYVQDEDKYYRRIGSAWVIETATTSQVGTVQLADAAAMEAETASRAVTADLVRRSPGVAKAWVTFNGTGTPAITSAYNVSSITDNGAGDYTINLGFSFSSTGYAWASGGNMAASNVSYITETAKTVSSLRITVVSNSSPADVARISVIFYGDI